MNSDTDRLWRERQFHDERFGGHDVARRRADKFYALMQRPRRMLENVALASAGRAPLLDYGCSTGESAAFWARHGIDTTGIDLSPEAIRIARERVKCEGLDANLLVMNAEELAFREGTFGVVVGTGILHHLDVRDAFREIARVLRSDGTAVFIEPLGRNPLINLYRALTPSMRSADEHPLGADDLRIATEYFGAVRCSFHNLTTLCTVPLRTTPVFASLYNSLRHVDEGLFRFLPFTRDFAWMVMLQLSQPRRSR